MPQHGLGGLPPVTGAVLDGPPVPEQGDLHDLVTPGPHPHVGRALGFLQAVGGDALQAPLHQQRQGLPVSQILQVLGGLP